MIKNFPKISFLLTLGWLLIFSPFSAKANGPLEISFWPDPLFSALDLMPGDQVSGEIRVKNNSGQSQSIYLKTKNVIDPDHLANVLNLKIEEAGNNLYNNSLAHLFSLDKIHLSDLANGSQTRYDLTLTFDISAGNEYQRKRLQFDLVIGTALPEEEGGAGETVLPILIGGQSTVFLIFNVQALDILENQARITWETNLPSTSQLIFSAEDEAHNFDPSSPPKYGYSHLFPLPEDSNLVIFHSLLLSNLRPCTNYYFRVISHQPAQPPSISPEFSFKTLCLALQTKEKIEKEEAPPEISLGPKIEEEIILPLEVIPEEIEEIVEEKPEEKITEEKPPISFLANLLAGLGNLFENLKGILISFSACLPWWLILIFAIYPLIRGLDAQRKNKKETNLTLKSHYQKQKIGWFGASLIPVILALLFYIYHLFCLPWWVLIILALATIFGWYLDRQFLKRKIKKSLEDQSQLFSFSSSPVENLLK